LVTVPPDSGSGHKEISKSCAFKFHTHSIAKSAMQKDFVKIFFISYNFFSRHNYIYILIHEISMSLKKSTPTAMNKTQNQTKIFHPLNPPLAGEILGGKNKKFNNL